MPSGLRTPGHRADGRSYGGGLVHAAVHPGLPAPGTRRPRLTSRSRSSSESSCCSCGVSLPSRPAISACQSVSSAEAAARGGLRFVQLVEAPVEVLAHEVPSVGRPGAHRLRRIVHPPQHALRAAGAPGAQHMVSALPVPQDQGPVPPPGQALAKDLAPRRVRGEGVDGAVVLGCHAVLLDGCGSLCGGRGAGTGLLCVTLLLRLRKQIDDAPRAPSSTSSPPIPPLHSTYPPGAT
jgi:hypothetical protein